MARGTRPANTKMLAMLWDWNKPGFSNGIQRLFELTVPKRSTSDQWLQMVLEQSRNGCQSWEVYCFVHGLPTRNPGSWLPNMNQPACGDALCFTLEARWEMMWRKDSTPWSERRSMECEVCSAERKRRWCIISQTGYDISEKIFRRRVCRGTSRPSIPRSYKSCTAIACFAVCS